MNIKDIILSKLNNLLNEDDVSISKLPQKKVVDDKSTHDLGVATAYSKNIDDKFRQLGVGVSDTTMLTPEILKNMGHFPVKFKLEKPTVFFDGGTNISGTATVDRKYKGLRLKFTDNRGEKVVLDFNLNDLKTTIPQTDKPINTLREKVPYNVRLKNVNTKVVKLIFVSLPNIVGDYDEHKNERFSLNNGINLTGKLTTNNPLDLIGYYDLTDLNKLLSNGVVGFLSASKSDENVIKIVIPGHSVIMLRPLSDYPEPSFVSNWINRPVEIGVYAGGKPDWDNVEGTATLKIKK